MIDVYGAVRGMKISGRNLSHCHFVRHKSHMTCPGMEPGPQLTELRHGIETVVKWLLMYKELSDGNGTV
jgi:hypothetical protein